MLIFGNKLRDAKHEMVLALRLVQCPLWRTHCRLWVL